MRVLDARNCAVVIVASPWLRVDRADHEIKLVEQLVAVIDLPVGENVRLDPFEYAKTLSVAFSSSISACALGPLRRQPARGRGLRMVGDADVAPLALGRAISATEASSE
jgi:hypothetical protein